MKDKDKNDDLDDGLYIDNEYLIKLTGQHFWSRHALEDSLEKIVNPHKAWVVFSVESHVGKDYLDAAPAFWKNFDSLTSDLSFGEKEEAAEKAKAKLIKDTGGLIVTKKQQAAFMNRELAVRCADLIENSEGPVFMPLFEITVPVDKLKNEILDGKRPFEVMLLNGDLFEVWGFGCEERDITEIHDVHIKVGRDIQFSGTFWALDSILAIKDAMNLYRKHEKGGTLKDSNKTRT